MNNGDSIRNAILSARTIAIAGHVNPDGDSIGSLLSLGLALEGLGKKVFMISPGGVPKKYKSLPGADRIMESAATLKKIDLAISVDCSSRDILGNAFDAFKLAKGIIEIDHHDFRRPFGDIQFVDTKAAAVGEMIYLLLKELKAHITTDVAQNLLTSIIVETDSFRLPNVRAFTFEVCTELIKKGVDFYNLVNTIFWAKTKESAILSGICMSRCKFLKKDRIVWSVVKQKDFLLTGGKDEDVDMVADEMRALKGVDISILFREKSRDTLRVSLRSKDKINVASVAERYNGGGHFDVAGCSIENSARSIKKFLLQIEGLIEKQERLENS